jgi:hypothetical protein
MRFGATACSGSVDRLKRAICEDCLALDVRDLHRKSPLRPGMGFSCSLRVGSEPSGYIHVDVQQDALQLAYAWHPPGSTVWTRGCQRVQITWTRCHFGGARPWFRCDGCGRRAAKVYLGGGDAAFACRLCHRLVYRSQSQQPATRAIAKARKLRVRVGGSRSLLDPFPDRPARMHRRSFYRLLDKAIATQERVIALDLYRLRARGFSGNETGVEN